MAKGGEIKHMLVRLLLALLNGVITYIVILIIVAILGMVGLAAIGAIIAPFAWAIAVLVGVLTFFGVLPYYWNNIIK